MFTGIVEEIGTVINVQKNSISSNLIIEGSKVIEDTNIGDSICTDGVCLTVTDIKGNTFYADVMAETLRMSALGKLKKGSKVNLERAVCANTRLGGHILSGHIDGIGTITSISNEGNATWFTIQAKNDLLKYMIHKGSIAVNGISLTIANLNATSFQVSIIPHTSSQTTSLSKNVGDIVNIECDIIGKYVERLIGFKEKKDITMDFLQGNGFL